MHTRQNVETGKGQWEGWRGVDKGNGRGKGGGREREKRGGKERIKMKNN